MQFFKRTTALFENQIAQLAAKAVAATEVLVEMLDHPDRAAEYARRVNDLEQGADRIVRETMALQPANLTPADRDELRALLERVDDVVDITDGVAQRLWLYNAGTATDEARAMARLLAACTANVQQIVSSLRDLNSSPVILDRCIEITRLENECDALYRRAMQELFSGRYDALHVLRWKDVYEQIEAGVNRCQEVARLVEGLQQAIA